ncbi:MAG TPA: hypothetical protein PLE36_13155 [Deltaproteobacteria bacterium]|nr:hypothetical protein [Deltaproteobacteria bacterium]HQM21567.1 hypothetical protein [Deltaproteobacteria bacterium]
MNYLRNLMDHDSREYGWSYVFIMTFGMAAAVWAVFDVLPTHPFPCWLLVGLLIAAEIVCLYAIISVARRCLLSSQDQELDEEEALEDLERRMINHDLSKGKGMVLYAPGERRFRKIFIVGRDEYMRDQ